MNVRKERNRRIIAICLSFVVITYAGINGAIKRGLDHDNYLVFGVLILVPVVAGILLYKEIVKLRMANREDEEIRKQLNQ